MAIKIKTDINITCIQQVKKKNGKGCIHLLEHDKQDGVIGATPLYSKDSNKADAKKADAKKIDSKAVRLCGLPNRWLCVKDMQYRLPALSVSAILDYCQCKHKFWLKHVIGLEIKPEKKSQAILMGVIWDKYFQNMTDIEGVFDIPEHELLYEENLAKVHALIMAFQELGMREKYCKEYKKEFVEFQYQIHFNIGEQLVVGYADRAYPDYIVETKLSARPGDFLEKENIELQAGTYLLDETRGKNWLGVSMEVTRVPMLRIKQNEAIEGYANRMYKDIMKRPKHYFSAYNKKEREFGKKFYKSEFALDRIRMIYRDVFKDMRVTVDNDSWLKNFRACKHPYRCEYYPIYKSGAVSEELYQIRKRKDKNKDKNKNKNKDKK